MMADIGTPGPPSAIESQHSRSDSRSVTSSGSRSSRSRGNPAVETAVTRLLVSIKALLEALTLWSELKVSENEVSDVYVRLGNDFNSAVAAFSTFNIEMAELLSVPDDLRGVLEECLSEDANTTNLNKYLPTVRQIITGLLQGLRGKQTLYRQVASQSRHRSSGSSSSSTAQDRDSRASTPQDRDSRTPGRSSHVRASSSRNPAPETPSSSETPARRSATGPSSNRTSRRRDLPDQPIPPPPPINTNEPPRFVGGFAPNLGMDNNYSPSTLPSSLPTPTNGFPTPTERLPSPVPTPTPPPTLQSLPEDPVEDAEASDATPQPPPLQRAPPSLKRYSLVDRPTSIVAPPAVVVDSPSVVVDAADDASDVRTSTPPPETPPMDIPAMASSLAALKKSDALERRASKRFSTYTFSKMAGSAGSLRGPSAAANRKSLAASNVLTAGELAVLAEDDEAAEEGSAPPPHPAADVVRTRSRSRSRMPPMPRLPEGVQSNGASPAKTSSAPKPTGDASRSTTPVPPAAPASASDGPVEVFLQIGREVKKVQIEPGCTLPTLRMLFLDRFSYNPGKGNFPAIYIRDPASGIQYELEDMDELKEKCLLSLNIEPLDQIKQHIDVQMASLAQDIKDLKSSVTANKRQSYQPAMAEQSFVESTPMAPRPSDRQFSNIARRISRFVRPDDLGPMLPQGTGQSLFPQMTGASVASEATGRIVADLKSQFDEVQNLRRDLGVMRQLYTDFAKQTKDALGGLRAQTQTVRQLADTQIGGARAYIVSGKTTLDTRSQDVLTRMEELQDLIETVKDDVLKRQITPKPQVMASLTADERALATDLKALEDHIATVRPMWKKTWEEELQMIVEEQQFLSHQEDFLADLRDDQQAVSEILGHVAKVISIRKATPGRARKTGGRIAALTPVPTGEDGGPIRDNVLLEIRSAAIDPDRRMKAIAANQKTRERELASRADEFEQELTGFVDGARLRKTGGAEEAERVRQVRNDTTLKAMFTGGSAVSTDSTIVDGGA